MREEVANLHLSGERNILDVIANMSHVNGGICK